MAKTAGESTSTTEDLSTEVKQSVRELYESIEDLKQSLKQFNDNCYPNIKSHSLSPLLKAKIEWTNAYAINSLFWVYLKTKGVDPQDHPIKQEIIRLKSYGERLIQIEDKEKAMKLDTKAVNRFVRSALWEPEVDSEKHSNVENTSQKRKFSNNTSNETTINSLQKSGLNSDQKRHKKFKK